MNRDQILSSLGLVDVNPGAYAAGWLDTGGEPLTSFDPTTGEPIASINQATVADYESVVANSIAVFREWRMIPAPERGQYVRRLANALREYKEPLGALVSYEMGKIKAEGEGEVQEMIDIADFAVGLSRQLYGLTMTSERPRHRMYEQWHPLGPVGLITSFNFPVAVWSWNASDCSGLWRHRRLEAVELDTAHRGCRHQHRTRGHGGFRVRGCLQPRHRVWEQRR